MSGSRVPSAAQRGACDHTARSLPFRERLIERVGERVGERVRVPDAVRLRVRVPVGELLATR